MRNSIVFGRTTAIALAVCVVAMGLPTMAQTAHGCRNIPFIINIDVPPGFQTQPAAINDAGAITGGYRGQDEKNHCFLRSPAGSYTDCEPTGVGANASFGWSINNNGQITGVYRDANLAFHGFIRNADGSFVAPIDVLGAGTGNSQGTTPYNINSSGEIGGEWIDGNNVHHGFVRSPSGAIDKFDAPDAGTGPGQGTYTANVDGLNAFGVIVGASVTSANSYHAFERDATGNITQFDVPGQGMGANQGAFPGGINQAGTVEGAMIDSNGVNHGFVLNTQGITVYDVAGAGTGAGQGTANGNINQLGEIAAFYVDSNNVNHGFVREPNGMVTRFDAPGAGTGSGQGTFATCNNATSQVTGLYIDNLNKGHGFLRSCH